MSPNYYKKSKKRKEGALQTGLRGHPLSTYAKFSEKLTFLTP